MKRLLLVAALLGTPLTAQVTPVAGTGCGGTLQTLVGGSPQTGQQITITNPFACTRSGPGALGVVGIGAAPASVSLNGCQGRTCTIGVLPDALAIGPLRAQIQLSIPADPRLVGICFYAQSGCISAFGSCFDVDVAVQVCVQ